MIELCGKQPIFVGLKLETGLLRQLESISGAERRYVSSEDSTYLRLCKLGGKHYVGKVIDERLTTERIQDIERNILSILQRLLPDERLPKTFEIVAVGDEVVAAPDEEKRETESHRW